MHIEEMELETTILCVHYSELRVWSVNSADSRQSCVTTWLELVLTILLTVYSSSPVMGHVTQDILVSYWQSTIHNQPIISSLVEWTLIYKFFLKIFDLPDPINELSCWGMWPLSQHYNTHIGTNRFSHISVSRSVNGRWLKLVHARLTAPLHH